MNKRRRTVDAHPDMLEAEESAVARRRHRNWGREKKKSRSPLRDITYLSGSVTERKQQLAKLKGTRQVRGDKHYMRKRKVARDKERKKIRETSRGVKHLYTFWRNVRSPTDVSFEEWFALRYAFPEKEHVAIRRYDVSLPYFLDNLYLAEMRGTQEGEFLADATSTVGTRTLPVKVYVAPPGRMDRRRNSCVTISVEGVLTDDSVSACCKR